MKRTVSLVILSLFLAMYAGLVYAQPGGGGQRGAGGPGGPGGPPGFMMGGGPGMMMGGPGMGALFSDEARRDIGLTDKQVEDIQAVFRDGMRPQPGGPMPPGPNATEADRRNFMQAMQTRMSETVGKVENLLTREQLTKARARSFQAGGGYASLGMNPFAQAALDLTEAQKEQIRGFQQEMGEKMRKFFEDNRPTTPPDQMSQEERQQFFARMQQFGESNRQEIGTKIQGILNDEQKKQGDKLLEETPEYIKRAIEASPRPAAGRGQQGGGQQYRPGADSWQPGQGAPSGGETPQRRFPQGGNRRNNN